MAARPPGRRNAENTMNHKLWTAAGARVIALAFLLAGAAACGERSNVSSTHGDAATRAASNGATGNGATANGDLAARAEYSGLPRDASPSAVVIGTAPAQPTGDTPETTPASAAQSQLSKAAESQRMPQEGDNHSYSTLDPTSPQKAGSHDPAAERSTQ